MCLALSCLIPSEKAQALPKSTILTALLDQLWCQDCYSPKKGSILHHQGILGDHVLKQ